MLGVELDSRLNFSTHTNRTLSRSRRLLGFVTRVTTGMPASAFRCLYTALVLPALEYCSAVWLPQSQALQTSLASVQRRAAYTFYRRTTPKNEQLPYVGISSTELLRHASWQPLDSRVRASTVRLMCRVMSPGHQELPYSPRLNKRTGRLQPLLTRTQRHGSSWLPRAAALWRRLPSDHTRTFPPDADDLKTIMRAALRAT